MPTETDLRSALASFADEAGADESAVRDRIHTRMIAPARPLRLRLAPLAAVAACIAIAVGVALTIVVIRHHHTPAATHTPPPPGPTIYGMPQFPGTVVFAHFSGTGSKTFDAGNYTTPKGMSLAVVITCRGTGRIAVASGVLEHGCSPTLLSAGGGDIEAEQLHPLTITTAETSAWQLTLIARPPSQTNAGVISPPVTANDEPTIGTGSGRGNGTVSLAPAAARGGYDIFATCTGSGLTISDDSKVVRNDYTHTCFAGFSYNWHVAKGAAPTELKVRSSPDTSWTIVVTPSY